MSSIPPGPLPEERREPPVTHYEWRMTCGACPEAYDLYLGDEWIGYVRYRHGYLTATVVGNDPNGDHPRVFAEQVSAEDDGILTQDQRNYLFPMIEHAIYRHRFRNRALGVPWEEW